MATVTPEVAYRQDGALARIVLNRPRAINALTLPMVTAIAELLEKWAVDDTVQTVSIEGAGERGLCAGGDVVAVRRAWLARGDHLAFFRAEYRMNALIATYPKPVVSFQDGIVMGGGVGISSYAGLRVVTDRSKVAMPETVIGFFPDVGALYLLSRAPGELGTHLALSGETVTGADAIAAGLSDVQLTLGEWEDLLAQLASGAPLPEHRPGSRPAPSQLAAARSWIDECYAGDDAVEIVKRLDAHEDPAARAAGGLIATRSPISVAATLEALRRAATMDSVQEVLEQDIVLADHLVRSGDFLEGVRAQLVDKDRAPHWKYASLAKVPPALMPSFFA